MAHVDYRSEAIHLAASFPAGSEDRVQILASLNEEQILKMAISKDTEAFLSWALQRNDEMSPSSVERFLEKVTGHEATQPVDAVKPKRGPLEEGEIILCDAHRNGNPQNVEACEKYHDRVGVVKGRTPEGLVIQFYRKDTDQPESGAVAFFDGVASGKGTGLYRWTMKADYQERAVSNMALLEIVYLRGGTTPPPQRDIDALQKYVEEGLSRGENRSEIYQTGYVGKFAYSKEGNMYFVLSSQQRDRPTTISPTKGRILYLGYVGKRPGGWKADAKSMGIAV